MLVSVVYSRAPFYLLVCITSSVFSRMCTPRSCVSARRGGMGCTPHSYISACRADRGCSPHSGISACREGTPCTPRSYLSPRHEGRGCTPRSCLSACRAGRGCSPRIHVSACRGGRGCNPHSRVSACRAGRGCIPCNSLSASQTRGAHHAVVFISAVRALDSVPHHCSRAITSSRAITRDGLFVPRASKSGSLGRGDDSFSRRSADIFFLNIRAVELQTQETKNPHHFLSLPAYSELSLSQRQRAYLPRNEDSRREIQAVASFDQGLDVCEVSRLDSWSSRGSHEMEHDFGFVSHVVSNTSWR